jgi:hypothetical protein
MVVPLSSGVGGRLDAPPRVSRRRLLPALDEVVRNAVATRVSFLLPAWLVGSGFPAAQEGRAQQLAKSALPIHLQVLFMPPPFKSQGRVGLAYDAWRSSVGSSGDRRPSASIRSIGLSSDASWADVG